MHAQCWQHRCVPSSTTCPRAWQAWCGASSTSSLSVYACPVLATPVRAFVHDASPGLAKPPRCVVNNIFSPAHHYFDTTAPMLTRRPLAPAAPRRLSRHRPPRLDIDHDILRTATSTTAPPPTLSATSTMAQWATACLSNLVGFHSSHDSAMRRPFRLWGGVRRLAFGFFSSLIVCVAAVVTAGGC